MRIVKASEIVGIATALAPSHVEAQDVAPGTVIQIKGRVVKVAKVTPVTDLMMQIKTRFGLYTVANTFAVEVVK